MRKMMISVLVYTAMIPVMGHTQTTQQSELIAEYQGLRSYKSSDHQCGKAVKMRIDAPESQYFYTHRDSLEKLASISRTLLWIDCEDMQQLIIGGFHSDKLSYQGAMAKRSDWQLYDITPENKQTIITEEETPTNKLHTHETKPVNPTPSSQSSNAQQVANMAASKEKSESVNTTPLQPTNNVSSKRKDQRGMTAAILANTLEQDTKTSVNTEKIRELTGLHIALDEKNVREKAIATLRYHAAKEGDMSALKALGESASDGSLEALYQLGLLYGEDHNGALPHATTVYKAQTENKDNALERMSHIRLARFFLETAAQKGNQDAQTLLKGLIPTQRNTNSPTRGATAAHKRASNKNTNRNKEPEIFTPPSMIRSSQASKLKNSNNTYNKPQNSSDLLE